MLCIYGHHSRSLGRICHQKNSMLFRNGADSPQIGEISRELDACVITMARVFVLTAASSIIIQDPLCCSGGWHQGYLHALLLLPIKGRSTELCSHTVETTWSPFLNRP